MSFFEGKVLPRASKAGVIISQNGMESFRTTTASNSVLRYAWRIRIGKSFFSVLGGISSGMSLPDIDLYTLAHASISSSIRRVNVAVSSTLESSVSPRVSSGLLIGLSSV